MRFMLTGHRNVENKEATFELLKTVINDLPGDVKEASLGGADGADTMGAQACVQLDIPFDLFLPNQYYWWAYDVPKRDWMYEQARKVSYVVDRPQCDDWRKRWDTEKWWRDNFTRNQAMVESAEYYLAISNHHPNDVLKYREIRGGTAACIRDIVKMGGVVAEDGKREIDIHWLCPIEPERGLQVVHYTR